jgi:hypothetical protein
LNFPSFPNQPLDFFSPSSTSAPFPFFYLCTLCSAATYSVAGAGPPPWPLPCSRRHSAPAHPLPTCPPTPAAAVALPGVFPRARHGAPERSPAATSPPAVLGAAVPIPFYSLFPRFCKASVVINPTTLSLPSVALLCPLPCDHQAPTRRRTSLAKICRVLSTPSQFSQPVASPPPPLALRPELVQPRPPLRRNRSQPEPPFTGAAEPDLTVGSSLRLISGSPRYTDRLPTSHWCSCALPLPAFAGPSPGTPELRCGRRTFSSTAKFHYHPSSVPPSGVLTESRRSCLAHPPRRKARRRREHHQSRPAGHRQGRAGTHLQLEFLSQGPQRKDTEDPPKCFVISCHAASVL